MNVGDRTVPIGNEPPEQDDGGHDAVGMTPEGISLVDTFLRTGEVIDPCGGDCDLGNLVGETPAQRGGPGILPFRPSRTACPSP